MLHHILFILIVLILIEVNATSNNQSRTSPSSNKVEFISGNTKTQVIILDVDNTLYNEAELKATHGFGIEDQITKRTYAYGEKYYNISKVECDEMYFKYGSTAEGIRHMLISQKKSVTEIKDTLRQYYNEVFDGIDMSCLLLSSDMKNSNTGYNHDKHSKERQILRSLLQSSEVPIYLASNSPKGHVLKVIKALGLSHINFEGIITPDSARDTEITDEVYPTKNNPSSFYHPILQKYDTDLHNIWLLDDSSKNTIKAADVGIQGIQINGNEGQSLLRAISYTKGHMTLNDYQFSDVQYLQSKNQIDLVSINKDVWENLLLHLSKILQDSASSTLRIVDLGAGLLSMLQLILEGGGGKRSLVDSLLSLKQINEIEYIAYESNARLRGGCWDRLYKMGFIGTENDNQDEHMFVKNDAGIKIVVKLRVKNFTSDVIEAKTKPDLLIGCCFADLFEPNDLSAKIFKFLRHCTTGGGIDSFVTGDTETLLYFPITFAGTTQFVPPKPYFGLGKKVIPSDSLVFQVYAQSLISQHGHNLDPQKIVDSFSNSESKLLARGSSAWYIDPESSAYLWETLMFFFTSSTGPMMSHWDFKGWVERARNEQPSIHVLNEDLLFSLSGHSTKADETKSNSISESILVEEIMFNSPYNVSKVSYPRDTNELKPGQVEGKGMPCGTKYICFSLIIILTVFFLLYHSESRMFLNL